MIMQRLLPLVCLLALTSACDDNTSDTDISDDELEQLEVDSINPQFIDELSDMPDNDQNDEDPNMPEVGDIVDGEDVPDRSVYLMNGNELPLKFLLLRVGDLEFSEIDTPVFFEWRAEQCAAWCSEHPEVNAGAVICEYRFDV